MSTPPNSISVPSETVTPGSSDAAGADGIWQAVLQRRGVRQFVKFCIVGASSTLIDFTIYLTLIELVHLEIPVGSVLAALGLASVAPLLVARPLAQSISFLFAVTNGFYWNSRWTFKRNELFGRRRRYAKFVTTNIVGLLLNITILTVVAHLVPQAVTAFLDPYLRDPDGFVGKVSATAVVVFWNFAASKYWTFKA